MTKIQKEHVKITKNRICLEWDLKKKQKVILF